MRRLVILCALALAGCVEPVPPAAPPPGAAQRPAGPVLDSATAAGNFEAVVARMEPAVERECQSRSRGANCDFRIMIDSRPGQPPNAFQTLDSAGRPIIAFTLALIAEARNRDELAFVMGHEAAHHIAAHIPRQQQSALTGALIFGALTAATGGDPAAVDAAQNIGGTLGARRYSKDFELEADALGTVIAWNAGFDPGRGAAFFARIPDPGNAFLGTHPPNGARLATVERTLARLRAGGGL
ncbi:MAG: peptidase M48 [Alphaproteobacteria bacterium HGW-Alphaproteobacteria-6]|nr:MAG: peptidase M48 [Alphaproteobacteria bacterium HGW-Alphaproteobacteria-6]